MGHEIKIGASSFVVDDPNRALVRVEKHEQVVEHPENGSVEATLRATRERKLQADLFAKTVFPIANERPQMKILEAFVQGRMGPAGVIFLWIVTGIPCALLAWGLFDLSMTHLHDTQVSGSLKAVRILGLIGVEAIFAWWIGLLLRNTFALFVRHEPRPIEPK